MQAHFGVRGRRNPAGALNRRNTPALCGGCHSNQLSAFEKSRHFELLRVADSRGPTCATCHGEVAAQLMAPEAVAAECDQCHGRGKRSPRPQNAADIRGFMERARVLRTRLEAAKVVIDALGDNARRESLRHGHEEAQAQLAKAAVDVHAFAVANGQASLDAAEGRVDALLSAIGAPATP
jgi:hypothetical protein